MNSPTSIIPGNAPAMKSLAIDCSVIAPMIIIDMLGGIRMPNVPPAAREPQAILFS
ncbi:hypothetical protein ES703_59214 [subsurface metagenome]